jgi:hypothetical protein
MLLAEALKIAESKVELRQVKARIAPMKSLE